MSLLPLAVYVRASSGHQWYKYTGNDRFVAERLEALEKRSLLNSTAAKISALMGLLLGLILILVPYIKFSQEHERGSLNSSFLAPVLFGLFLTSFSASWGLRQVCHKTKLRNELQKEIKRLFNTVRRANFDACFEAVANPDRGVKLVIRRNEGEEGSVASEGGCCLFDNPMGQHNCS